MYKTKIPKGADMAERIPYFQIYQGSSGGWYWRLRDSNHKTIADGSEGYSTRDGVIRAVNNVVTAVRDSDQTIHSA